jgi:hypothetical protein
MRNSNGGRVQPLKGLLIAAMGVVGFMAGGAKPLLAQEMFNGHDVVLDDQGRLLPWGGPAEKAYDRFLRLRWEFIKTKAPMSPGPAPRSSYPHYYFYCEYKHKNGGIVLDDAFMNDVGEKIPNWVESARLYYAYTGDASVMDIVRKLVDYTLDHGISPATFAWPNFPYTTTNAGDMEFRGFTSHKRFVLHEIQVDHAGDMGLAFYRMYLFTGNKKYLTAAINVADVLARYARVGTAEKSVWPYRVVMDSGKVTSEYGANWIDSYLLLDSLAKAGHGNPAAYRAAASKAREFILSFPMKTGYWTDGHSDNPVISNTYKSNMSASNAALHLFNDPDFDPDWKSNTPKLIKWTEDYFVFRTHPGEPATQWGANIVGEQDGYLPKMDYQTARYAAQCARWYAMSGDESYKEKAYRSLNWVTYCNNDDGLAFESPVSKNVGTWWSDAYGEGPRMFYPALAGVPEWAPHGENHILYSQAVIRQVSYAPKRVEYLPAEPSGIEYLRLSFLPVKILAGGKALTKRENLTTAGYTVRDLGKGDYAVTIRRQRAGKVVVQ